MKAKIKSVFQPKNENILEIEYVSGARRFCELSDSTYQMTKTQRDFMKRAKVTETETGTFWR